MRQSQAVSDIMPDAPGDKPPAYVRLTMLAELEGWDTSNPQMIICPGALKHGNLLFPSTVRHSTRGGLNDQPKKDFHPAISAPHCQSLSDYDYTSIVVVGGPQG
jgi:hypothetical protein